MVISSINISIIIIVIIIIMSPKQVKKHECIKLSTVKPTDEEMETVRQIFAGDPKAKKAKMASMAHYLKLFPDEQAANSRGDARTEYMELFLVHQMRQKIGTASVTSKFATEANQHRFTDLHWWSEETMDKNLGPIFAKHWRDSKLVPSKAYSLTGSTDPKHVEWGVPQNWERLQESDLRRLMVEHASNDADESDMKMILDASVFNRPADESAEGATSSGGAPTGPTAMAKLAAQIKVLRDEPERHARKYNDMSLALKRVLGQAEGKAAKEKYMSGFVDDIKACTKKTEKLEKTFTKMLSEEVEDKEFPKLLEIVKAVDDQFKELQEWCPKFGVSLTGSNAKAPKRKRAKGE